MSGVEIATAYVSIIPETSRVRPDVKRSLDGTASDADRAGKTAGKKYGGAFSSSAKAILGAAGGFFAATKVLSFGADSLQEAREAQVVGARTENVIKRMGGQSKITAKQVGDLSSAISKRVGIDDEAIQSGANLLLTFGHIRNEAGKGNRIFNRTTRLMVDMSKAMGTDAKGAAIQLGKALNDPVKGMSALTRVGVSFNETQKATVKSLIEGGDKNAVFAMGLVKNGEEWSDALKANKGDIADTVKALTSNLSDAQKKRYDFLAEGGHQLEAQKIILGEVEKQFGGAAKSMATPAEKAEVAYGNLKEQIGTELLPIADDFANFLTNKAIPAVSNFLDEMKTGKGKGGQAAELFRTIKDDAEKIADFVGDAVDKFNDMPDWAKKGLLVGGAGLYAGNKVRQRLGGGSTGGILSKGSTPVNPLYVSVVGGLPGTSPKTTPAKAATAASAAASTVAVAAAASAAIVAGNKKLAPKAGIYGSPNGGPTGGWKASDLKNPFGGFWSDLTGGKDQKALGVLGSVGKAVDGLTGKTDGWQGAVRGTNKQLDILNGKHPRADIKSNALDVLAQVKKLNRELDAAAVARTARVQLDFAQGHRVGNKTLNVPGVTPRGGNTFVHNGDVVTESPRKYVEWNERRLRQESGGG